MGKFKQTIKLISGLGVSVISGILVVTPPLTIIGVPGLITGLGMSYDGLMKKDLKRNIFKVSRKENELIENPFRVDRFIKCALGKDKVKNFLNESMNCFRQLDVYENDTKVKYTMKSHGFTKKRLEELQKMGYIENLEIEPMYNGKKKSFFLENLAMGNFKQLFKKKQKFKMQFNLTGKNFYDKEVDDYVDYVVNKHKDTSNSNDFMSKYNIENNNSSNVINSSNITNIGRENTQEMDTHTKIIELKKVREELLNSNENNFDNQINMGR